MKKYIISLDQGTTSSRALLFDRDCNLLYSAQREIKQIYPKAAWVEHDPKEIFDSSYHVIKEVLSKANIEAQEVECIGISNQRETTILWDRKTGEPIYNAIVWQCRRTASMCEKIKEDRDLNAYIENETGLKVDAYFSATKIKWILDNVDSAHEKALAGDLAFGTVDSWLLYNFTGGRHMTDATNASRTMLYNIKKLEWDKRLLKEFDIPPSILPEVYPSGHYYGKTNLFSYPIPIMSLVGDQQSSLFGQACFEKGQMKNTYGTGCFLLVNTGDECCKSSKGLITSLGAGVGEMKKYVLEGSVFTGGSVIKWLRDEMGLIKEAKESEAYALSVDDTNGLVYVPAFTGLGAPYWNMDVRGTIFGITRGITKAHLIRASLESIAYQCNDVIRAIACDTGLDIASLKVDGGASMNNFLMQFQADISDLEIKRPKIAESTAFGAAAIAGLKSNFFKSPSEIKEKYEIERTYRPNISQEKRDELLKNWQGAISFLLKS